MNYTLSIEDLRPGCRGFLLGVRGIRIAGMQKLTLLDYPGRLACTVFTAGCNLRCPFCHNGPLLDGKTWDAEGEARLLALLDRRKNVLEGVCVTGGEPLLQPDLPDLLREIRARGYLVKLDTNGMFPDRLAAVLAAGLADYVAMDLKNGPARWAETVGVPEADPAAARASAALLMGGTVDYEFRTTVVRGLHDEASLRAAGETIRGAKRWFLQRFVPPEAPLRAGLAAFSKEEMEHLAAAAAPFAGTVALRGI
jgi:pyruvate formate lyase activating enzyme